MGFEPTTLRDLVGCSNHLSYWRLYGEQGPICGSRLEPHHAATQPSNDRHTRSEVKKSRSQEVKNIHLNILLFKWMF